MIDETLKRLEARIRASSSPEDAEALIALVAELRGEIDALEPDDAEKARKVTASAAGDDEHGPLDDALLDLETAHPRIVGLLRSLSQTLSDGGI